MEGHSNRVAWEVPPTHPKGMTHDHQKTGRQRNPKRHNRCPHSAFPCASRARNNSAWRDVAAVRGRVSQAHNRPKRDHRLDRLPSTACNRASQTRRSRSSASRRLKVIGFICGPSMPTIRSAMGDSLASSGDKLRPNSRGMSGGLLIPEVVRQGLNVANSGVRNFFPGNLLDCSLRDTGPSRNLWPFAFGKFQLLHNELIDGFFHERNTRPELGSMQPTFGSSCALP